MSSAAMLPARLQRSTIRQYCSTKLPRRPLASYSPVTPYSPSFRHTTTQARADASSLATRVKNVFYGTSLVLGLSFIYLYTTDTRAGIHQWLVIPSLRLLYSDAEEAHEAGTKWLKLLHAFNLHPRERGDLDHDTRLPDLTVQVFGHVLDNPIGTSAGIDKHAEIPSALFALGPAIVEVGGATPLPQQGNPKPRVFRIPSQNALINRYGLNSEGANSLAMRLRQRVREYAYNLGLGLGLEGEKAVLDGDLGVPPGSLVPGKLLAVQVAKNKTTPDTDINAVAADYVFCVERLAKYADILVVNVSSPNTPGLRDLQAAAPLTAILTAVVDAAKNPNVHNRKSAPAVMVKVSPDEDSVEQISGICQAVFASGVDGVIVGNTTMKRPDTIPKGYVLPTGEEKVLTEMGGYSGPQMFERTLALVRRYRKALDAGLPEDMELDVSVQQTPLVPEKATELEDKIDASVQRDNQRLKPLTAEAKQASEQPLIQSPSLSPLPSTPTTSSPLPSSAPTDSTPLAPPKKSASGEQKVIFATGGITNGSQCLQILNAGASVCQIYTAMVYGGVGTVTRIKGEMRDEVAKGRR